MIHPTALILGSSQVGGGTVVGPFVVVGHPGKKEAHLLQSGDYTSLPGARVGRNCILRSHTVIYSGTEIGDGVTTGHHVLVREECSVGEGTLLGTGTVLDNDVWVGKRCSLQTGVYLPTGTRVGDGVFLGPRACVTNDRKMGRGAWKLEGVVIEDFARIGANSTLLPGIRLGRDCVVGAGAVVTKDVPPRSIVVGCPARVVGEVPPEERREVL